MKNFKIICLMLCVSLFLVGCYGNKNNKEEEQIVLTLWHYYADDSKVIFESVVDEFTETVGADMGVTVKPVSKGNISSLQEELTASARGLVDAEEMPDIFACYPDKLIELDEYGLICDLSPYFTEEDMEVYVDAFLEGGVYGERLLSIPVAKSTELLYVNKTTFDTFLEESGYEFESLLTWEELYDISRAYYQWTDAKTPNVLWDGESFMGIDSVSNYVIIANKQLGVDVIDGENELVNLDKEALFKIFEFYYKGISMGYLDATGVYRSDDVRTGNIVAYTGSSAGAAYFPRTVEKDNQEYSIELLCSLYPTFEGYDHVAIKQGAEISVSASEKNREAAAAEFIKWFTEYERNLEMALSTGYFPTNKYAFGSEEFNDELEEMRASEQLLQNTAQVYDVASEQIMDLEIYLQRPFFGSYDVRSLMSRLLKEISLEGKAIADECKEQGLNENDILEAIDVEGHFLQWYSGIINELELMGILYVEQ